jgi:predicted transposase YdaD
MAMFDYASGMDYATRKGREEGRQEGEAIGKQEGEQTTTLKHILSLSSKNKSTEEISDLLDLPIEYVRDVLNNEKTERS